MSDLESFLLWKHGEANRWLQLSQQWFISNISRLPATSHLAPTSTIVFISLTLFTIIAYSIIYNRFFHPLAHVPGPFWASVTPLVRVYHCTTGTIHLYDQELHRKYGSVVRSAPNLITSNDPRHASKIHHSKSDRPAFFDLPGFGLQHSFATARDHKVHRWKKRRMMDPYSITNILKSESRIDDQVCNLVSAFDNRFARTSTTFDFAEWTPLFTFDVVSMVSYGEPLGCVSAGGDPHGAYTEVRKVMKSSFWLVPMGNMIFGIYKSLPQRLADWLFIPNLKNDVGVGRLTKIAKNLIKETRLRQELEARNGGERKARNFLERVMELREPDGSPIPEYCIVSEIIATIFAGGDTTASLLRQLIDDVHSSPTVLARLIDEIDATYDSSPPSSSPVLSFQAIQSMKYLQICVRESLRLFAPVAFPLNRVVSSPGITLDGIYIPPGAEAGNNPWLLGRNEECYEAAETFRPERWLEEPLIGGLGDKLEFVWGDPSGGRLCMGKQLALLESWKVSAALLRMFRFTPVHPAEKEGKKDREVMNWGFWFAEGFWYKIERRDVPEWKWFDGQLDST
ncbi:cytochrome P450 [Ascobolus immersus RN42]|uniref:Cytochrome P450 n=1 Tax=Ascobolus immersus RN42 TaxID=1160509 RepID=A0A3N4IEB9_ASCIM|nr:cytochrome P450 [Ascobolus immersus RN42]